MFLATVSAGTHVALACQRDTHENAASETRRNKNSTRLSIGNASEARVLKILRPWCNNCRTETSPSPLSHRRPLRAGEFPLRWGTNVRPRGFHGELLGQERSKAARATGVGARKASMALRWASK